ncbi:MAG: hypothetical protein JNK21_00920 [Rhodospirillaceae bacterium]|nr:hypothetical protein [Rhodospirillaceae bacterium]
MGGVLVPLIGAAGLGGGAYSKIQQNKAEENSGQALISLLRGVLKAEGPKGLAAQAFAPKDTAEVIGNVRDPALARTIAGAVLPQYLEKAFGRKAMPEYGTSAQTGINPMTGKPDQFVVDKVTGQQRWLGAAPIPAAPDKLGLEEQAYAEWKKRSPNGTMLEFRRDYAAAGRDPSANQTQPDFKNIYDKMTGNLLGTFDVRLPAIQDGLNSGKYTFAEKRQDKPTQGENTSAYHAARMASAMGDIKSALENDRGAATTMIPWDNPVSKAMRGDASNIVQAALSELGDAMLTLGTGAAYTQIQYDNQWKSNLPVVGDSDAVLERKFSRIEALYNAAKKNAGTQGADLPDIGSIASLYRKSARQKTANTGGGGGWGIKKVGN